MYSTGRYDEGLDINLASKFYFQIQSNPNEVSDIEQYMQYCFSYSAAAKLNISSQLCTF